MEKLCIQHATISNTISRMEASGVISKQKDSSDKRISRVYLTDKGKEALIKIAKVWRTMEAMTTKGLTEEEENVLRELLLKVFKNLS